MMMNEKSKYLFVVDGNQIDFDNLGFFLFEGICLWRKARCF